MPNLPLHAAFAVGQELIIAQQVFADRVTEVAAFDYSLEMLDSHLAEARISPVADRRAPRRNVLVYYGVGGIGKTTLSHELTQRFIAPEGERDNTRAAARINFAEAASFDIETYILRLRATFGHLAASWPAFDIALASYWERAHPGESMAQFISTNSALRRVPDSARLAEQVASALAEVAGNTIPGVPQMALTLGSAAWTAIRKSVTRHRALRQCAMLEPLLDAEADPETLSYFPYLLAWQLDRVQRSRAHAAVFLDTFEEVTRLNTRDTERWLQRSAFLMPNVLFVVTGRNRLDWADNNVHELDYTGPKRWPNLRQEFSDGEPRQHLVGYIPPEDSDGYLASTLTTDDQPTIQQPIRDRIVRASEGLPQYLDLAVTMYLEIVAQGGIPVPDDFGQPLPGVAARILRDLDPDERNLLRTAALAGTFDLDLLRDACPNARDATLTRFSNRPFLENDTDRYWPYALHDLFRTAIRDADQGLPDSWSNRERDEAAVRVGGYLRARAEAASASGDRTAQVAMVRKAVELCLDTHQLFDWLTEAIQGLLVTGGWTALADLPAEQNGDALSAVLMGLQGARERRSGRLDHAVEMMDRALDVPGLPAELRRFLILHRAHALRVAGRYDEGAASYRALLEEPDGAFTDDARYWLADYSFLQGRFGSALRELDELPADPPPDLHGEVLRLRGHVHRVNALFDQAEASYRHALDLARRTNNTAAEGKALTDLVQTLAWHRPGDALALREQAIEANERLNNRVEIVKIHAASAVARTRNGELDEAAAEIERGLTLTSECAYPGGQVWCWVSQVVHRLAASDAPGAAEAADRVAEITSRLGGNRFWSQTADWWTRIDRKDAAADVDWIGGAAEARSRWLAIGPGETAE